MGMKYRLSLALPGVELKSELTIGMSPSNLSDQREQPSQHLGVIRFSNTLGVLSRDAKNVDFGLRIDVPKGNCVLVLGYELSTELSGNDLAKNTIQVFLRLHTRSETLHEEAEERQSLPGQHWMPSKLLGRGALQGTLWT